MAAEMKGVETLEQKAERFYKDNKYLQEGWLKAVNYLRNESKKGWLLDAQVTRKETQYGMS